MGEAVFFRNLTTKGLTAVNSGERYFEGFLTVQVKDKQGEVTIVDELMKVLPVWIDRGAPISDTHSNRIIGKGINYSKVEYKDKDGEIYPAIKVTGKIHKNYELDNDIWQKIKSGEYKGLSFGGATKSDREPMRMKDGSIAYSLKDLEHYEVAVCRDPAVPLALITEFNTLAKAVVDGEDLGGGRMLIKCDKYGCYVDKEDKPAKASEEQQKKGEIQIGSIGVDEGVFDENGTRAWGRLNDEGTEADNKEYKDSGKFETDKKIVESQGTFNHKRGVWEKKKGERSHQAEQVELDQAIGNIRGQTDIQNTTRRFGIGRGGARFKKPTTKDNSEAGLKAPEARNEALVYDDKTHDQPSETPEENQKKIKKGQKEEGIGTRQHVEETEAVYRHATGGEKGVRDSSVAGEEDMPKKGQIRHEIADEKGYRGKGEKSWWEGQSCPHCGKKFKQYPALSREDNKTSICSDCGTAEAMAEHKGDRKYKGEDWSNADGDMQTSMNTQNVDEGGMGKHKQKRDSVLQGYGGEQNNTGEVGWSGSGSPYPKKKGYEDDMDDLKQEESVKRQTEAIISRKRRKRKKSVITNIYSRLKSLDFLLRSQCHLEHEGTCAEAIAEESSEETKRKWRKRKKKGEAQLKSIQSRIEISDFLLRKDGEFGGMNTGEVEWTEPRDTANSRTKRDKDVA